MGEELTSFINALELESDVRETLVALIVAEIANAIIAAQNPTIDYQREIANLANENTALKIENAALKAADLPVLAESPELEGVRFE